jgi:hypothetical protein
MSELAQELRDLQAVCERFGIDDDDALNRAADRLETAESQLKSSTETLEKVYPDVKRKAELEAQLSDVKCVDCGGNCR